MELTRLFKSAQRFIQRLSLEDRQTVAGLCEDIRRAEAALNKAAEPLLHRCIESCSGLCCRNVRLAEIIGWVDFIYLLTVAGHQKEIMAKALHRESLFSGDCIFLKNAKGPCIFPNDARPRMCIISFCFDDTPVKNRIQAVNSAFGELSRFILSRRLSAAAQRVVGILLPSVSDN
jgi:hypothetical protein